MDLAFTVLLWGAAALLVLMAIMLFVGFGSIIVDIIKDIINRRI